MAPSVRCMWAVQEIAPLGTHRLRSHVSVSTLMFGQPPLQTCSSEISARLDSILIKLPLNYSL